MRKKTLIILIAFTTIGIASIQSCKDKNEDISQEFIADNNTFLGNSSWSLDKTYNGPDPLLGAMAHANNDDKVVREIRFKKGQNPVNLKYPVGTLIVKHSYNPDGTVDEYTAMSKRGNNYNPNGGDWEFFVLTSSGTIATDENGMQMRGATLMNGMCVACHSAASSKDYIFSK
jgi:hypothetical protein